MTGNEIIAAAQYIWGGLNGANDPLMTTAMWQQFVNDSMKTLYNMLPPDMQANTDLQTSASQALTSGGVTLGDSIHQLLAVRLSGVPLPQVDPDFLANMRYNELLIPRTGCYAFDPMSRRLEVRPDSIASVTIEYLSSPADVSSWTAELTTFNESHHQTIAYLVAELAFKQEEDFEAANFMRESAIFSLGSDLQQPVSEGA